jgi:hypothetical protein
MDPGQRAWDDLLRRAQTDVTRRRFGDDLLTSRPAAAQRYLTTAVAPGTPLAPAARLSMRGRIRLGRWLPFRAGQLLAPRHGTVWKATVAG